MAASDKSKKASPWAGNGGAREGAGRKASEATKLRTEYLNTLHMDAVAASVAQRKLLDHLVKRIGVPSRFEPGEYVKALDLLSTVAEKIQNRAWGKPTPMTPEGDMPKGLILDL